MQPNPSDPRVLRPKLLQLLSAVQQYFEATTMTVAGASPVWMAFDALRRNQALAQEFVADLNRLLEFLSKELGPSLAAPPSQPAAPPPSSLLTADELSDQETMLLGRLPASMQATIDAHKQAKTGRAEPATPTAPATTAPPAPPVQERAEPRRSPPGPERPGARGVVVSGTIGGDRPSPRSEEPRSEPPSKAPPRA